MSTFKKYLKIINETKDDMSLAVNTPNEIAKMNKNEINQLYGQNIKLDKNAKKFLEQYAEEAAQEVIDYPKRTVLNKVKKLKFLPNNVSAEEYKNLLGFYFNNELFKQISKKNLNDYFINVESDKDGEDPIWITIDNEGYNINLDFKKIEKRPWENKREWSSKRNIVKPTQAQTNEWYKRHNDATQRGIAAASRDARKRTQKIEEINKKQNSPINMGKKANREKYGK